MSSASPDSKSSEMSAAAAFVPSRLERIREVFEREVAERRLPGAAILLAHKGAVVFREAIGFRDREAGEAMRSTDVFRIASMTKPVTTCAALMLAEEGKLILPDPVAKYLAAFAQVEVAEAGPEGEFRLVEPRQPMTVHDLMRHTSGLTYGLFGQSRVKTMYNEAGVFSLQNTNEQMTAKLAQLPLAYQPGSTWDYGMSTDVLGHIVEVVSGQSLATFFQERFFGPLRMPDTGFALPHVTGRVAEPQADSLTGLRVLMADPTQAMPWQSGGAGLSSTADDYLRFAQMLLKGGELDGTRYLSPSTVALMASDHLPPGIAFDPNTPVLFGGEAPMPAMGQGFGLGVAVRTEPGINPLPGSVGNYYWGGALGTYFWIDPKQELIAIMMTQAPADRLRYRYLIQQLVYQAFLGQ